MASNAAVHELPVTETTKIPVNFCLFTKNSMSDQKYNPTVVAVNFYNTDKYELEPFYKAISNIL